MEKLSLTKIGAYAAAISAILAFLWLIGEPFLEDYVDTHIEAYDKKKVEDDSKKAKLRRLLGEKMGVDDDEVHIELGHLYKNEKSKDLIIDSLIGRTKYLENEIKLNLEAIQLNYQDIKRLDKETDNLRQHLDRHGLFR